jgi:hypothetical protein
MEDKQDKTASAKQDSTQQEGSLPFFTRFLEGQDDAGDQSLNQTLKYPSDRDEWDERIGS